MAILAKGEAKKLAAAGRRRAPAKELDVTRPQPRDARMSGHYEAFSRIFRSAPNEKIEEIRRGVPATSVGQLSEVMGISKETLIGFLGLSRATLNRKVQNNQPLSRDESERVVGVQTLIGQVQAMVEESGVAEGFDAAKWVSRWLSEPLPALGGQKPADYMDTIEGQKLVANLLAMAQSGAYA
jgi:putative toxin-antitoxin system antitoxin component (TIGR02293 family)